MAQNTIKCSVPASQVTRIEYYVKHALHNIKLCNLSSAQSNTAGKERIVEGKNRNYFLNSKFSDKVRLTIWYNQITHLKAVSLFSQHKIALDHYMNQGDCHLVETKLHDR